MDDHASRSRPIAVPAGRYTRLARFGGMAGGIAANAAADGVRRVLSGERPALRELMLTPANLTRLADEMARMRGAAMKMGQLLSMDAGDVLPPELSQILARLRADADHMPPRQLRDVLNAEWGTGWLSRFEKFDVRPIAAASIGQVHRARLRDGRVLAIKVQYPGVRRSIDSDVRNIGALLRVSGMLPPGLDLAPFLEEARRQLHLEADYRREAGELARFGRLVGDDPSYVLPEPVDALTTQNVLAMTFVEGMPVEALETAEQAERDRVARLLIDLAFRELFAYGAIQSDPNFANFRYNPESGRVVLLDYGAARDMPAEMVERYRDLFRAGFSGDRHAMRQAALDVGFFTDGTAAHHQAGVLEMIETASAAMRAGPFDFGDRTVSTRMRDIGMALTQDREFDHVPPMDTLYLQRKFAGLFLLATRLRARVDLRALAEPHL